MVPPEEWWISRVCEEFSCTPLEALEQPIPLVRDVLELRSYAQAKRRIDEGNTDGVPPELVDKVFQVQHHLLKERQRLLEGDTDDDDSSGAAGPDHR